MDLNHILTSKPVVDRTDVKAHLETLLSGKARRYSLPMLRALLPGSPRTLFELAKAGKVSRNFARTWLKPFVETRAVKAVESDLRGPGAPRFVYSSTDELRSVLQLCVEEVENAAQRRKLEEYFGYVPAFSEMKDLAAPVTKAERLYFCQRYMHLVAAFTEFCEQAHQVRARGSLALLCAKELQKGPLTRKALCARLDLKPESSRFVLQTLKSMQKRFGLVEKVSGRFYLVAEKRLLISYAENI